MEASLSENISFDRQRQHVQVITDLIQSYHRDWYGLIWNSYLLDKGNCGQLRGTHNAIKEIIRKRHQAAKSQATLSRLNLNPSRTTLRRDATVRKKILSPSEVVKLILPDSFSKAQKIQRWQEVIRGIIINKTASNDRDLYDMFQTVNNLERRQKGDPNVVGLKFYDFSFSMSIIQATATLVEVPRRGIKFFGQNPPQGRPDISYHLAQAYFSHLIFYDQFFPTNQYQGQECLFENCDVVEFRSQITQVQNRHKTKYILVDGDNLLFDVLSLLEICIDPTVQVVLFYRYDGIPYYLKKKVIEANEQFSYGNTGPLFTIVSSVFDMEGPGKDAADVSMNTLTTYLIEDVQNLEHIILVSNDNMAKQIQIIALRSTNTVKVSLINQKQNRYTQLSPDVQKSGVQVGSSLNKFSYPNRQYTLWILELYDQRIRLQREYEDFIRRIAPRQPLRNNTDAERILSRLNPEEKEKFYVLINRSFYNSSSIKAYAQQLMELIELHKYEIMLYNERKRSDPTFFQVDNTIRKPGRNSLLQQINDIIPPEDVVFFFNTVKLEGIIPRLYFDKKMRDLFPPFVLPRDIDYSKWDIDEQIRSDSCGNLQVFYLNALRLDWGLEVTRNIERPTTRRRY